MKKYFIATTFLSIIVTSLISIAITKSEYLSLEPEHEWIVSTRNLTVQDGINKQEARQFLETEYFPLFEQLPGMNAMLGIPDRGVKKGDFILIYTFDSKWTRDYHFPESGEYSEEILRVINGPIFPQISQKYFTDHGYDNFQEYLMFARAK